MIRPAVLALLVFSLIVGAAQATPRFGVHVADELPLQDYPHAAVGLLVPGAGPETSREQALAALLRGKVENSLRGGFPAGPPVIQLVLGERRERAAHPRSLPQGGTQPNDRRYVVVVSGRGYQGILTSDSTRIPGLVSITDIAPTALGEKGALGSQPDPHPAETLRELDSRIDDHNGARLPASIVAAVLVLLLALRWPRAGLLGFGGVLVANLVLGLVEVSSFWPTQIAIALAALSGLALEIVFTSELAVGLFLAGIVAAYLIVLGVDGSAVALSPFGPTQNARFYGISNLLETMLLVPALAGAYYLQRALGWIAFAAVALVTFIAVAANRFGADGGGAIVLAGGLRASRRAPRSACAGCGSPRRSAARSSSPVDWSRWTRRWALPATSLGRSTPARGASRPTFATASGSPGSGSSTSRPSRSSSLSACRFSSSSSSACCAPTCRSGGARCPSRSPSAVAVSLVVNDSPNDVITAGLVGYVAVEAVMLRDRCAALSPSPGSSPGSPSSLQAAARPRS